MRRYLYALAVFLLAAACSADRKEGAPVSRPAGGAQPQSGDYAVPAREAAAGGAVPAAPRPAENSPPEIRSVWFVGGDGSPGNTLGVESEVFDADGDPVQVEVAWQKNGQPAGNGNRLPLPVKRGDNIVVTITPSDGKVSGRPGTLTRVIRNTPPLIEGHDRFQFDENVATLHVRASDADGDPLTYSLKDAPAGMRIDRNNGVVRWVTSPGTIGRIPFTVVVADGADGEATARFTVTIAEQSPSDAR